MTEQLQSDLKPLVIYTNKAAGCQKQIIYNDILSGACSKTKLAIDPAIVMLDMHCNAYPEAINLFLRLMSFLRKRSAVRIDRTESTVRFLSAMTLSAASVTTAFPAKAYRKF